MHYYTHEGSRLVCLLCAYYCHLKEGQKGICGVNQNVNGAIKNLVYGYPVALHVDPVEKNHSTILCPILGHFRLVPSAVISNVLFVRTGVFHKKKSYIPKSILNQSRSSSWHSNTNVPPSPTPTMNQPSSTPMPKTLLF